VASGKNDSQPGFFIRQPVGSRALEICPDKVHQITDATGYIQGCLVAGARPQWLKLSVRKLRELYESSVIHGRPLI